MGQCSDQITELESLLRLRTFPVAFKHMETAGALADIPKIRKITHRTFCQLVTLTRTAGFTIGIAAGDTIDPLCLSIIGLRRPGPQTDTMLGRVWFTSQDCAVKQSAETPHIPMGGAIALAPARAEKFTPDVVLVYGTPTQILLLVNGVQYDNYATVDFSCVGEATISAGFCAKAPSATKNWKKLRSAASLRPMEDFLWLRYKWLRKARMTKGSIFSTAASPFLPNAGLLSLKKSRNCSKSAK